MNEQNYAYLKDQVKYMGFGESLFSDLEAGLKSGLPEFQLSQSMEIHKKPFDVTLNFRRSGATDLYFFNSYQASLRHTSGETREQLFYLERGKGVTAKEAYNLLDGRAVYKELSTRAGETYKAWLQLDFEKKDRHNNYEVRQYHESYGYDLKAALSKYSIAEMDGGDREKALLQSLHKGNLQAVGLQREGGLTKLYIEANPRYKAVTFYDSSLRRVPKENLSPYLRNDHTQEVKNGQGKAVTDNQKVKTSREPDQPQRVPGKTQTRSAGL